MYNYTGCDNVRSGKPATRSGKREIAGNGKIKGNQKTTNLDWRGFAIFDKRLTRVMFVSREKDSET